MNLDLSAGGNDSLLIPSERKLVKARGERAAVVRDARNRLVMLYRAWGKPDSPAAWQARIDRSLIGTPQQAQ